MAEEGVGEGDAEAEQERHATPEQLQRVDTSSALSIPPFHSSCLNFLVTPGMICPAPWPSHIPTSFAGQSSASSAPSCLSPQSPAPAPPQSPPPHLFNQITGGTFRIAAFALHETSPIASFASAPSLPAASSPTATLPLSGHPAAIVL
jgi:hypothetical protein